MRHCSKCGTDKPISEFRKCSRNKSGLQSHCKVCQSAATAAWTVNNKDRRKATNAEHYRRTKEQRAEYGKAYRKANKQKINERIAQWQANNKDKVFATRLKWHSENRERLLKTKSEHQKTQRAIRAINEHRRRAKKRLCEAQRYSLAEVEKIKADQAGLCANPHCCADINQTKAHVDHIQPLCKGGADAISNIQWLCAYCNLSKHTSTMEEFISRYQRAKLILGAS